jgi:predicted nucleic acid-binding protein
MRPPKSARESPAGIAMLDSPRGLIDTGAMLAMLDRDDRWHLPCAQAFTELALPLATSAAVLAELFHLLDNPSQTSAAWDFLRSGAVRVLPIADEDLQNLEALMLRYRDRPMDFADATLVHLAKRESLATIFTVDHDDFETYRIEGKRRFRIVPDRRLPTERR